MATSTGQIPSFNEWLRTSGAYGKRWTPGNTARDAYDREMALLQKTNAITGAGNPAGGTLRTIDGGGGGTEFNLNPSPRGGNGPYGLVPGPLGLPDPHGDLAKVLPNLDGLNAAGSSAIMDQLGGKLSPATIAALSNAAAERGVAGGMPGAQTWDHLFLGNLAGATEDLINRGVQNYSSFVPTVSRTQTVSPDLQADIANQNAVNAAAPDPAAASEAERLFNKYKSSIGLGGGGGGGRSGGGNPAGGTLGLPNMPHFNPTNPATTTGTGGGWGGPPPTGSPAPYAAGPGEQWQQPGGGAGTPDYTKWDSIFDFDFGPPTNPAGGTAGFNGTGPTTDPSADDWMNEYLQWSF